MITQRQTNTNTVGIIIFASILVVAGVAGCLAWLFIKGPYAKYEFNMHNGRGNWYYEHRNYPAAVTEYSAMIEIFPKKVDGYLLRGNAYSIMGKHTEAQLDYTSGIALTKSPPMLGDLYFNRGRTYDQRGNRVKAIADFTEAIRYDPNMRDVYETRATIYLDQKKYAEALADCNTALAKNPKLESAYCLRARVYMAQENDTAAIDDFKEALVLNPRYEPIFFYLSRLYEREGAFDKGVALYKNGLRISPQNVGWRASLGWFEYLAGDIPASIQDSKIALGINPTQSYVAFNLGLAYATLGDWPHAQTAYQSALSYPNADVIGPSIDDIDNALIKHPSSVTLKRAKAFVQANTGK